MKYYVSIFDIEWEDGTEERIVTHMSNSAWPSLNRETIRVRRATGVNEVDSLSWFDELILELWDIDVPEDEIVFETIDELNTDKIRRLTPYKTREEKI